MVHKFWIRPDFEAEIMLPADLTPREAEKIGALVKLLPISSEPG
jgi:hypothetical protein